MSTTTVEQPPDELKQSLDQELSQLVHEYSSRGLDSNEIVDSLLWHSEVAETSTPTDIPLDQYIEE